jgi:hypothetical protein
MEWAGHVIHAGCMINSYNILVGKTEGKRPSGRTRRRGEDNSRIDLLQIGSAVVDWIHLA